MADSDVIFRSDIKERAMENPLALITSLASGKNSNKFKGIVKRDCAHRPHRHPTKLESNADPEQPSEFKLLVEERRIIESIAGNENLEIQAHSYASVRDARKLPPVGTAGGFMARRCQNALTILR